MRKSLFSNFRNAVQDSTEKRNINVNTSYNLRQKAAHLSIIQGKTRVYLRNSYNRTNRINTELVSSQTFHNNRMADGKYLTFTFT